MRIDSHIPLDRQFLPVLESQESAENDEILSFLGHVKPKAWDDLDHEFRCVILAEAGAGKTEELRQHAKDLSGRGILAFFIRIEDIETDFYQAFEIGEVDQFQTWLQSVEEAWFFLDSVDEARLENPSAFEKALRLFANGIKSGAHRAHIYLSSRPYAWRPVQDRKLVNDLLYLASSQIGGNDKENQKAEPPSALTIYTMHPLDKERVRCFCEAHEVKEIDRLLREIERANLWSLAERPFDLEGILAKWEDDFALGSRLELIRHNIDKRLRDEHNSNRAQRQPLNLERAREGARRLAAAVVLTGQAGLNVPDATTVKPGIEAETVLADWDPKEVRALLERGVFNDIIYGAVRFRHRDVRELLAAEWFDGLLKSGNSRNKIESLFFREQYGEEIITPRLRPTLPWLIILDDELRRRALEILPEIAVEGGDPSKLPLIERRKILSDIVNRIALNKDDRSARDNCAIARIANPDLSIDTQQLIDKLYDNDEAVFFLGRLVWQGEMASCVITLVAIALDNSRGIYARIASARAVMTCGSVDQKRDLWKELNKSDTHIPRELLVELVQEANPDSYNIKQLLISVGKLAPCERHNLNGLSYALYAFIKRLSIDSDQEEISQLLDGFKSFLDSSPYVVHSSCRVSEEYAWLIGPAMHTVRRLVEARSSIALGKIVLSTMLMIPALRYWRGDNFKEQLSNLQKLVLGWPELNDSLYWASIELARSAQIAHSSEPLIDDGSVYRLGHVWNFDATSLPRLIDYMHSRPLQDDRQVALSTAFRVFVQTDKLSHIQKNLQDAVADDSVLRPQLENLLNPPLIDSMQKLEKEHAEYLREMDEVKEKEKQNRDIWIAGLRANPDRVRNPPNLAPGSFTKDQYILMEHLRCCVLATNRTECANWQALIPDFSEAVAIAYRDAAINHWRHYVPTLQSEGVIRDNTTPYSLIFALAGLEIEAAENPEFPRNLDESLVHLTLRYITWELNGFPNWLERMHRAFPNLVEEAVIKELLWELENSDSEPMNYILQDLVYNASWLHKSIAPVILHWMEANPTNIFTNRHHCLHILVNGEIAPAKLAALAKQQISNTKELDSISWWYALRVHCDPIKGIYEVDQWLSGLNDDIATHVAQIFITTLMGGRSLQNNWLNIGSFRISEHLKSLYILAHRYIRTKEDINRTEGEAYSPELRDDAQNARSRLFNLLSEIPGKESYTAIKQLIYEHPDADYRSWMAKRAYKRAEEDGDLEPWTAEQVYKFDRTQTLKPETHSQLYDVAVNRLHDLKNWVEYGNDSPYKTWQRVENETEMRNLIAGYLNNKSHDLYITAQEPELANSQHIDICMQNNSVQSPVPIELKLLDKGWTGPDLCERLRNQLVGDYLREETAGCGVMLLIWQGNKPKKRWIINGHRVELCELSTDLKSYWQGIAYKFSRVKEIDVIVIDLTKRAQVCNS